MSDKPPLFMRVAHAFGVFFIDMDFVSAHGRAKAGETWCCLCISILGRGRLIPVKRRSRHD